MVFFEFKTGQSILKANDGTLMVFACNPEFTACNTIPLNNGELRVGTYNEGG